MKELWKPIPEFPNYAVSTTGRIKRIVPVELPHGGYAPMKIIKPMTDNRGYHRVLLSNRPVNPKRKFAPVHRLVLLAFAGLPADGLQVNHRNGIKTDNRLSNLEWVTASANIKHSYRNGLQIPLRGKDHWTKKHPEKILRGDARPGIKLTQSDIVAIKKRRANGETLLSIAKDFGVCFQRISQVCSRRSQESHFKPIS